MIQVGLFFFAEARLDFSPTQNLWLAVLHGATYVVGALLSHPLSDKLGEKRTLVGVLVLQALLTAWMAWRPDAWSVWVVSPVLLTVYGLKWPVVESYVVAGRTPRQTTAALGKFNVTWSASVALAGTFAGVLIKAGAAALFLASVGCTAVTIALCVAFLPRVLQHLDHDHPERPDPALSQRYGRLLRSCRWTMMSGYALERVALPLLPMIFASMGVGVAAASALAMLMAWSRTAAFAWLGAWPGWHGGRKLPLCAALLLPVTILLIVESPILWVVLLGLIVFGVCEGVAYTGSLYYAMVLKNASVDAGGAHEAIIGGGFVVGPLAGLGARKVSATLTPALPSWLGMTLGLSPLFVLGLVGGLLPLRGMSTVPTPQTESSHPMSETK